jgi:hypothetical protein
VDAWQIGISSLHSLAAGQVESDTRAESHGPRWGEWVAAWQVADADLEGTGLTLAAFAQACGGDLHTAATAFLLACRPDADPSATATRPATRQRAKEARA